MTEQPKRWLVLTAADPTVERIFPKLAKEIGLNESILLMQIAYWISVSKNVREGVYWTYSSVRTLHRDYFPYWSTATIWRTINNLKEAGYILVGEFNERKGDNTQWFALEPDKLSTLTSIVIMAENPPVQGDTPFQNETPPFQNETTLPKTSTKNKKKTISPSGDAPRNSKPKPERPRNPIFDAVALGSFGIANVNGDKTVGALVGKIVKWLKDQPDVTAERVTTFYGWYARQTQNADAPRDAAKFGSWWLKFAQVNGSGQKSELDKMFDHMEIIGGMPT